MEESETEDHLAELFWFHAIVEEVLLVRDWLQQVGRIHLSLKTLGRLICHLNTILKDGDWEST